MAIVKISDLPMVDEPVQGTDLFVVVQDNVTKKAFASDIQTYVGFEEVQTATAGQTVFNLTQITYAAGANNLQVFVDGVNQYEGSSYTETDNNTVTFTQGLHEGALVKFSTVQTQTSLVANAGAVTFLQAGTGAIPTNVQAKLREYVSVKDFGAAPTKTNAENKLALQSAISAVNALGGGYITIPSDINYGYKVTTSSSHPNFSGVTSPIQISDYSPGNSYSGYPTAYDGAQVRLWQFTPQTTSFGQHDGNTVWQRAAWAPAYLVSNDANLAPVGSPSRTADDNRRASLFFANDGAVTWRVGQGTLTGAGYTDQQLSNFTISAFGDYGGASIDGTSAMLIDRVTGNFGFNVDPVASYHFKSKVTGFRQGLFESLTTTADVTLRNSNGASDDVSVQNVNGICRIATKGSIDFIVRGSAYTTKGPTSVTNTTYTVVDKDTDLIVSAGGTCTITLPSASDYTGRAIYVLTRNAQSVVSASSNVVPLVGGPAATAILAATAGKWARLISDGAYWQINMAN